MAEAPRLPASEIGTLILHMALSPCGIGPTAPRVQSTAPAFTVAPENRSFTARNDGSFINGCRATLPLAAKPRRRYCAAASGAGLAQLVEHLICNQGVAGSNPASGTIVPQNHLLSSRRRSFSLSPISLHSTCVVQLPAMVRIAPNTAL